MSLRLSSAYVSVGAFIRLVVSLISVPVLVRFLGLERYGVWTVLNSVIAIGALLEIGLSTALTNYLAADCARQDWLSAGHNLTTALVLITYLGFGASIGMYIASPLVSRILFGNSQNYGEALAALGVLSWLLVTRFWQQWAMAVEAAFLRYDWQTAVETAGALLMQLGVLFLALTRHSLWMLSGWLLFATGVTLIGHYLVLGHLLHQNSFQFQYSWRNAGLLFHFGITQWVSSLGSSLFGYADRIIVNFFLGSAAAGLYSAATSVTVKINELSAIPLRVLPPAISAANALLQQARVHQVFLRATRLNGVLVFLIASPIMFWARPLAQVITGQENVVQMAFMLQVLAVAYGLYSLNAAGFFTAIGMGYPIINTKWALIGGLLVCLLLVVFTPWLGLAGAAWANAGYVFTLMINLQVTLRLGLDFRIFLRTFLPAVCIVLVWGGASTSIFNSIWSIWGQLGVFVILEVASVVLIAGVEFLKDVTLVPLAWINARLSSHG